MGQIVKGLESQDTKFIFHRNSSRGASNVSVLLYFDYLFFMGKMLPAYMLNIIFIESGVYAHLKLFLQGCLNGKQP